MITKTSSKRSKLIFAAYVVFIVLASLFLYPGKIQAKNVIPPKASNATNRGLASLYPGDEGIERDPRVLFVDDFETGTTEEIGARWGSISKKENITLSEDIHANSPGNRSIHISKNGHIFTHTKGVDTIYARFYVKFHKKTGYVHHFVHLVADRTPTPWPKGG
ncbi:MAG: hypothetical protein ACYSYL_15320, partial [Planctomycetota bacterium]